MRTRGVQRIAATLRRLTLTGVAVAVLTLVSLHAFDRGYGATDEDVCAAAGCPAMAPALAELVESQQALGRHCTSTPRLSDVVAVDDGRGGATLSSLAEVVATGVGKTQRTVVYCR